MGWLTQKPRKERACNFTSPPDILTNKERQATPIYGAWFKGLRHALVMTVTVARAPGA